VLPTATEVTVLPPEVTVRVVREAVFVCASLELHVPHIIKKRRLARATFNLELRSGKEEPGETVACLRSRKDFEIERI